MIKIKIINNDCLKTLEKIAKTGKKFDLIITDPPYGTTELHWDKVICFKTLLPLLYKVLSNTGRLILFGLEPFYSNLFIELQNSKSFEYSQEIIWDKNNTSNPYQANTVILKRHEKNNGIQSRGEVGNYYPRSQAFTYIHKFLSDNNINAEKLAELTGKTVGAVGHYRSKFKQWAINATWRLGLSAFAFPGAYGLWQYL